MARKSRNDMLTAKEVAEPLRVTATTVHRWINDGKLTAFKLGGSVRIPRWAVDEFIEQSKIAPPQKCEQCSHSEH